MHVYCHYCYYRLQQSTGYSCFNITEDKRMQCYAWTVGQSAIIRSDHNTPVVIRTLQGFQHLEKDSAIDGQHVWSTGLPSKATVDRR